MNKKWHPTPPPSVGWWPTSAVSNAMLTPCKHIRWWDGKNWSVAMEKEDSTQGGKWIAIFAATPTAFANNQVQWQERPASWPARSRT